MLKKVTLALIFFLSSSINLLVYRKFYNWEIEENVTIGISYLESDKVVIQDNVKIGNFNNFNIIRKLKLLEIGQYYYISYIEEYFYFILYIALLTLVRYGVFLT